MVYSPKKYRETEGTKVRRLGFALDEATLKQVAFNHGITQSFESMTQAQKSQLRYVTMIEQAKNIGVTGDMSRTIEADSDSVIGGFTIQAQGVTFRVASDGLYLNQKKVVSYD